MQSWHDWAAYCADAKELPKPIQKWKYTIYEGLAESVPLVLQSPYALTTIVLEIPVIIPWELKASKTTGASVQSD
jgi:hypothetical protein